MTSIESKFEEIIGRGYMISVMVHPTWTTWFLHKRDETEVVASGSSDTLSDALDEVLALMVKLPMYGGYDVLV